MPNRPDYRDYLATSPHPRRPGVLPTDMHGKLAVRTGETTVAVGVPVKGVVGA